MNIPKVRLIDASRNPIKTIASAFRTCRRTDAPWDASFTLPEDIALIERCLPLGHRVPLEQCSLTFGLSGQSRVFSAQFLRARLTSPVQQSQRAVHMTSDQVVCPDHKFYDDFKEAYSSSFNKYESLIAKGVPKEKARYVLPIATASNIQITMNLAEFIHICNERLCWKAQEEHRLVVLDMVTSLTILGEDFYALFRPYFVPKCAVSANGFCREKPQCSFYKDIVPTRADFLAWRKSYPLQSQAR